MEIVCWKNVSRETFYKNEISTTITIILNMDNREMITEKCLIIN